MLAAAEQLTEWLQFASLLGAQVDAGRGQAWGLQAPPLGPALGLCHQSPALGVCQGVSL